MELFVGRRPPASLGEYALNSVVAIAVATGGVTIATVFTSASSTQTVDTLRNAVIGFGVAFPMVFGLKYLRAKRGARGAQGATNADAG